MPQTVDVLLLVLDREGGIVLFNRACEQLTGFSFEEVNGKHVWDLLVPPEKIDAVKSVFTELRSGTFPDEQESHWLAKDGSRHLIRWSCSSLLNKDGAVEHVIGTGIDITEHKQQEEALQKQTLALAERVKELNCLYALSTLLEKSDISLPEICQGLVDIIPAGWQYPEITCARLVLENQEFKTPRFWETPWKQSSPIGVHEEAVGTVDVFYLEEKPECDERPFLKEERNLLNALAHRLGKAIERKQAEAQILRSRDEWVRTFDAVPDLIMILDNEHRIVRVNRAMADRLGCRPEDLVGLNCHKVVHTTEEPPDFCPHTSLLNDGRGHHIEVYEGRLGGDFLVSVSPLYNPEGRLTGSVHVARDITERKQAEEALRKAHDELEKRVQERTAEWVSANQKLEQEIEDRKRVEEALRESENRLRHLSSQLLAIQEKERKRVAQELHDGIGQMLTAIKFKVENTLEQREKGNTQAKDRSLDSIIPMIQQSIEEVRRIQMDLRPSILDDLGILATIGWFCREFQTVYSTIHVEKQISLQESEVSAPLKTVIYRVIQEALNNIAKHSRADRVHLSLSKLDGKIELAIKDNGVGFVLEDALSIESPKRGFGLSGMRERVELSGGAFWIESRKGSGTTVRASWSASWKPNEPAARQ